MNILVVTGSARPTSASHNVAPVVVKHLNDKNVNVELVDASELNLPFFNAPVPPSAPDFEPTDENVIGWTNKVAAADAVVLVTPEYNGGPSAVQKNAIDWIYRQWENKPVVMIGYGWYQPSRVHESLKIALTVVKATQGEHVQLQFGHEIEVDGTVKDEAAVAEKIEVALASIVG